MDVGEDAATTRRATASGVMERLREIESNIRSITECSPRAANLLGGIAFSDLEDEQVRPPAGHAPQPKKTWSSPQLSPETKLVTSPQRSAPAAPGRLGASSPGFAAASDGHDRLADASTSVPVAARRMTRARRGVQSPQVVTPSPGGPTPGFLANGGVKNISSTAGSAHRPVRQPEPEGPISALVRNGAFFQEGGSSSSTAKRPQHGKGVQHQPSQLPAPLRAPSFPQGGEEPDPNPPSQPPSPSQLLRDLNAEIERENLRQPFLYFNTGEQGQQEDQRTHKIFEDGRTTTPMYMLHSAGVNIRIRALMGKQTTDSRARLLQARREKLLAQINAMDGALEDCVRNLLASNPAYQNDVANLSALGCSFLIIWDKLPAEKQKELGEQAPQLGGCARDLRAYWDQTTQLCELLQWKWRMLQQIIQTEVDLDNMQHEDQQRNIESGRIGPSDQTRQLQQQNKILQDKYSEFDDIVRLVQMNRIAEPDITPLGDKDQEKTLAQIRFLEERLDLMRNVQEAGEELRSIDLEMTQLENTKKSQYHDIDDIETDLQNALPIGAGRNPLQNIRRRLSSSMEESSDVRARELGRQLQQLEQRRKAMLEEIEELNRQYMVLHAQRAEVDRELLDTEHLGSKSMHVSLGLGAPDAVRQLDEHIQMGPDFQIPGKRPLLQSMALDLKAQREELSKVIVARHQELRALRDKVDAVCEMQVTHRAEESGGEIGLDALFPRSVLEKDGVDQFLRTRVGAAVDHDPVHRQISAMVDPLGSYLQYHHERDALRQGRLRSSVLGHIGKWNGETVQSARERQKKNAADGGRPERRLLLRHARGNGHHRELAEAAAGVERKLRAPRREDRGRPHGRLRADVLPGDGGTRTTTTRWRSWSECECECGRWAGRGGGRATRSSGRWRKQRRDEKKWQPGARRVRGGRAGCDQERRGRRAFVQDPGAQGRKDQHWRWEQDEDRSCKKPFGRGITKGE